MKDNQSDSREIYNVKIMRMFSEYMEKNLFYDRKKIEEILSEWGVDFEYLNIV